ncbi:MAG TPA: TonB-dependent receptor [Kofleriaceae bacterium]|jgi:outer membrane receptor protein involved in Fe transport
MQWRWTSLAVVLWSRLASADDDEGDGEVIVVEEHQPEPGEVRLSAAELDEVAGALGDPIRATTSLPGMVPTNANRPEVYVRGAPPGNTEMLVDGMRVPLLFHGGVATSIVPSALIAGVAVYPSAAPAQYGGIAGGVIALETVAPASRPRAEARLTVYEGGGLVETPVANERGSVLAAARFGDPQLILGLVSDADVKLRYWDYQTRATWKLGDHSQLALVALGSHDHLSELELGDDPMTPEMWVDQLVSDFHRVELRFDRQTTRSRVRAALTGGWTKQGAGGETVRDLSGGARVEGELRLASTVLVRTGVRVDHDAYKLVLGAGDDPARDSLANAAPAPRNTNAGLYSEVVWDATKHLRFVPGMRLDAYHSERAVDGASGTKLTAEPRLAVRWRIQPELALTVSAGLAHQYPLLRVGGAPATAITVPGFWADARKLQSARQASVGLEWLLPEGMTGTATVFASETLAMTDLARTCQSIRSGPATMDDPPMSECGDRRTTGLAYGLELSLRRPLTARLGGWLGYTFSRSTEENGTQTLHSPFDRTHVASASLAYQLTPHWRAGARVTAYSGAPFLVSETSTIRLPWYERVDLRADRTWQLGDGASISLVFDVLNATLSRDHDSVTCTPTCTVREGNLFFVPSIGIEGTL